MVRGRRAPGKDVLNTRFKDDVIKGLTNKIRIVTEFEWKIVSSSFHLSTFKLQLKLVHKNCKIKTKQAKAKQHKHKDFIVQSAKLK